MGEWKGNSNPGGPGGRTRKIQVNKPYRGRPTNSHKRGGPPAKKGCCPMVEAGRSLRRGKFRLAGRYAWMSVRLLAERAIA